MYIYMHKSEGKEATAEYNVCKKSSIILFLIK